MLPPAVRNFGPTRQLPGDLSSLSRESSRGQTSGHDSGQVSRGWPLTALHVAVREPCGHHTKEIRRDSAHYQLQKVNNISILGQLPIPRVDEILDKLGSGRIFSFFDVVFSFHQITVHKDTSHGILHAHASLRVVGDATREQRSAGMVRQGDQRSHQRPCQRGRLL